MKQIIFLILSNVFVCLGFSQKEHNVWYFGKGAGIEFTKKGPKALVDGPINTHEGCATVCDKDGNFIMSSDGYEVWDAKHMTFTAGYGGHLSSTQSALIVKRPEPKTSNQSTAYNLYYIFAVGHEGAPCYVNEMTHTPGDSMLNITSTLYREMMASGTEKLIAAPHANGKDTWVLMHPWESDEYHAYLITSNGIAKTPIISKVGVVHGGEKGNATGYLKVSPCGKYVASCIRDKKLLEIFSFDNSTGKLTKKIAANSNFFGYGLEFSPDGSKLYASVSNPVSSHQNGGVIQIDLNDINEGQFEYKVIGLSTTNFVGALQLGPNGKIYVARFGNSYLGVINNPNASGNKCDYVDDGVYLEGKECLLGLPNYTATKFCKRKFK